MKTCSKCKAEKPFSEFSPHRKSKDGFHSWCKACNCAGTMRLYNDLSKEERTAVYRNRKNDPSHDPEYRRKRYANDIEHRERAKRAAGANYHRLRATLISGYGSKCACCGETQPLFLEIDHVNGGGSKDFKENYSATVYRRIVKEGFPTEYQLLCANCNKGRFRNGGVCPHVVA